uniref:Copia protein n=1 Tax=Tanacetum cinerariifolium TaxID=118510 RepID=A0A6L2JQ74_TANCI|nr:copia protein [Tanacetum cinerariifolium]
MKIKEPLNVTFDKSPPATKLSSLVDDDDVGEEEAIENNTKVVNNSNEEDESIKAEKVVNIKDSRNHPLEQVIANDVWDLFPLPMSQTVIGTKWVFRNKLDENGIVSRNKAKLVAQRYNLQEGIDYNETYTLVAKLESIRILLASVCANDFKLYQMDVKSAFLNGFIIEEVYIAQPLGFIDFEKPNYVYKLKKTLYGLKQAPKACHAGNYTDRKSTSGVCTFMGCRLTSWFTKKQTTLAISITEAVYVSSRMACQQALWMKQALIDYDIRLDDISIMCDNKGAIALSRNHVQHSRTKHIEIRHHFLHDNVQKGKISIEKIASEDNIDNILTKPLKWEIFSYLRLGLENDRTRYGR